MKPRKNKYNYLAVIKCSTIYGWEDVSKYEVNSSGVSKEHVITKEGKKISIVKADLKEYNASNTGAHRLIYRKELNK